MELFYRDCKLAKSGMFTSWDKEKSAVRIFYIIISQRIVSVSVLNLWLVLNRSANNYMYSGRILDMMQSDKGPFILESWSDSSGERKRHSRGKSVLDFLWRH